MKFNLFMSILFFILSGVQVKASTTASYFGKVLVCEDDPGVIYSAHITIPRGIRPTAEISDNGYLGEDNQVIGCRFLTGSGSRTWIHCDAPGSFISVHVAFPRVNSQNEQVVEATFVERATGERQFVFCKVAQWNQRR